MCKLGRVSQNFPPPHCNLVCIIKGTTSPNPEFIQDGFQHRVSPESSRLLACLAVQRFHHMERIIEWMRGVLQIRNGVMFQSWRLRPFLENAYYVLEYNVNQEKRCALKIRLSSGSCLIAWIIGKENLPSVKSSANPLWLAYLWSECQFSNANFFRMACEPSHSEGSYSHHGFESKCR